MSPTSVSPNGENSRSRGGNAAQTIIGAQVTTIALKSGLPSSIFVGKCPRCSTYRRHVSAGVRRCKCGATYRIVVGAVVGAHFEAAA